MVLFSPIYIIILVYAYLSIKMTSYELRDDGLFVKRGIIAKKQSLLLYTQIQDVSEYQNLLSRIIGLKALQIQTMTASSALAGRVQNLTKPDAERLKSILLQEINKKSKGSENTANIKEDISIQQDESKANPFPIHYMKLALASLIVLALIFTLIIIGIISIVAIVFSIGNASLIEMGISISIIILWSIIIWIFIAGIILISSLIQQYTFKYWFSQNTLAIKSGLLSINRTSIEYEKIQDFIVSNSLTSRILGLKSVRFETGSVIIIQNNNNNNQLIPNYAINAIEDKHIESITDFLMSKMGMRYRPNPNPIVNIVPLSTKKPYKKTLSDGFTIAIIAIIILSIVWLISVFSGGISGELASTITIWVIIVFSILLILEFIYQQLYLKYYYYDASANTLTIRKGVIGQSQIYLQFNKIQNVFMDQDLLDRLFGLYDVHLSTVGHGSIHLCHIDGLTKENAEKVVGFLLQQIKLNSQSTQDYQKNNR
jgi:uncharacterized membrane protein YdbT with pleckstrin-like domain